jgi:hypothetical protein
MIQRFLERIDDYHEWFFSKVGPFCYFFYFDAILIVWGVVYWLIHRQPSQLQVL